MPKTTLNLRRHTNLTDEIEMHKPRTDWVTTLVTIVLIIGFTFCVYGVLMVLEALEVVS